MEKNNFSCSLCSKSWKKSGATNCWSKDPDNKPAQPGNCPSKEHQDIINDSFSLYKGDSDDAKMAQVAAKVEGLCYQPIPGSDAVNACWTRVEDTLAFAKLMGYQKVGIASCIGLLFETDSLAQIFKAQGFAVVSVCCKSGSIDKKQLGLREDEKIRPGTFEPACNPVAQAELLNQAKTDLNMIVGLCVGHDILFNKYSDAPVTTIIVKDRVTGHNPVSVLYGQNFYYKKLQLQPIDLKGEKGFSKNDK